MHCQTVNTSFHHFSNNHVLLLLAFTMNGKINWWMKGAFVLTYCCFCCCLSPCYTFSPPVFFLFLLFYFTSFLSVPCTSFFLHFRFPPLSKMPALQTVIVIFTPPSSPLSLPRSSVPASPGTIALRNEGRKWDGEREGEGVCERVGAERGRTERQKEVKDGWMKKKEWDPTYCTSWLCQITNGHSELHFFLMPSLYFIQGKLAGESLLFHPFILSLSELCTIFYTITLCAQFLCIKKKKITHLPFPHLALKHITLVFSFTIPQRILSHYFMSLACEALRQHFTLYRKENELNKQYFSDNNTRADVTPTFFSFNFD